jgi:hypothetical protein
MRRESSETMDETLQLRLAREAIEGGDRATGRNLLLQLLRHDPGNEVAWIWLSAVIDDPAKERDCLKQALKINPDNATAREHLARLTDQADRTAVPPPVTPPSAPKGPQLLFPSEPVPETPPAPPAEARTFNRRRLALIVAVGAVGILLIVVCILIVRSL